MAFESNEYGRSIAAPGLVVPDQPKTIVTGIIQSAVESEGGFPVWGKKGEDGKVYASIPQVPDTSGTKNDPDAYFAGIVARVSNRDGYEALDNVNVLTKGHVYVKVATDVKSGAAAYITSAGKLDATTSGTAISGAKFLTSASADGLAVLELA